MYLSLTLRSLRAALLHQEIVYATVQRQFKKKEKVTHELCEVRQLPAAQHCQTLVQLLIWFE